MSRPRRVPVGNHKLHWTNACFKCSLLNFQEMQRFSQEVPFDVLSFPSAVRRVSAVLSVVLDQTEDCEDPQFLLLHCSAACLEGKIAELEAEIWNA